MADAAHIALLLLTAEESHGGFLGRVVGKGVIMVWEESGRVDIDVFVSSL